jgi:Domain of unknown function (DUF5666)
MSPIVTVKIQKIEMITKDLQMTQKSRSRFLWIAYVMSLIYVLVACGPGEGGSGNVIPDTGVSVSLGRVDGFGSTIVEGQRYTDKQAVITIDENPAAATAAPLTAVKLGKQIALNTKLDQLDQATVGAEVIGPVSAIQADKSAITVLGQRIIVTGHPVITPVIDGFGANDILVGQRVEVNGIRLSTGDILATRLEKRSGEEAVVRLAGTVQMLDSTTQRFSIGNQQISYANAERLPSSAILANGQRVVVYTNAPKSTQSQPFVARVLRIEQVVLEEGMKLSLAGPVLDLNMANSNFTLRSVNVEGANATYPVSLQSAALLRNDAIVRVSGTVKNGRLIANTINVIEKPDDAPIVVTGAVSDYSINSSSFRMRGTNVSITPNTQYMGGNSENLGNGVVMTVRGSINNGLLVAQRTEVVNPTNVVVGRISNFNAVNGQFSLPPYSLVIRTTTSTTYMGGTVMDLANDRRVHVTGVVSGNNFFDANEVILMESANAPAVLLAGTISNSGSINSGFYLNNRPIFYNSATLFTGGATATSVDLISCEGKIAIVRAIQQGTDLVASSVEFKPKVDVANSAIGYASDFVSVADFRVAGQQVNASGAIFVGGDGAKAMRNGLFLLVEGSMANGILSASRVEILPN